MAFVTPEGILQLFEQLRQLSMLNKDHYLQALHSLVSPKMSRQRADLAVLIHRNFRFMLPDDSRIRTSLQVGLIILCDKARESLSVFDYWLQEAKREGNIPHAEVYRHLMWGYAHQGDVDGVERLFREFVESRGIPT